MKWLASILLFSLPSFSSDVMFSQTGTLSEMVKRIDRTPRKEIVQPPTNNRDSQNNSGTSSNPGKSPDLSLGKPQPHQIHSIPRPPIHIQQAFEKDRRERRERGREQRKDRMKDRIEGTHSQQSQFLKRKTQL